MKIMTDKSSNMMPLLEPDGWEHEKDFAWRCETNVLVPIAFNNRRLIGSNVSKKRFYFTH